MVPNAAVPPDHDFLARGKSQYKTLWIAPATAAGVTSRLWDIVHVLENWGTGAWLWRLLSEGEERFVADGKKRTAQGRKDPKLLFGPFDRDKRIPQCDDLLAVGGRMAADQHVWMRATPSTT